MHFVRDSLVRRGEKSWRVSFHPVYDDASRGEREFFTISNCVSRREANRLAEEIRAQLEEEARRGLGRELETPTVLDYQREWAESLMATRAVADSTAMGYVGGIKALGEIAYMKMGEVDEHAVREAVRFALDEGLSPNTVATDLGLLRNAFERALDDGLVEANPCRKVKPPKRVATRPRSLSAEERLLLLSALPEMTGPLPVAVRAALCTGVRGEEVRGFRWEDWDEGAETISVRNVVTAGAKGQIVVKEPKTPASLRTLPVERSLGQALAARKKWQMDRCAEYGTPFNKRFFVLGDIDGKPYSSDIMLRDFRAFCKAIGLECRFHWLRHTFATGMIAKGVNVRTVAQWLGHTDPGFTLRVYVDADQEALTDSLVTVSSLVTVPPPYTGSGLFAPAGDAHRAAAVNAARLVEDMREGVTYLVGAKMEEGAGFAAQFDIKEVEGGTPLDVGYACSDARTGWRVQYAGCKGKTVLAGDGERDLGFLLATTAEELGKMGCELVCGVPVKTELVEVELDEGGLLLAG